MFIGNKGASFIALLGPFPYRRPLLSLTDRSDSFPDGYFRGMTSFLSTQPKKIPHPSHPDVDGQILMTSDLVMDFPPLRSRGSCVSGREHRMSAEMHKGTFGS